MSTTPPAPDRGTSPARPDRPERKAPSRASSDPAPRLTDARPAPHALIQESIKYRRRAQDAERRLEAVEAELADLRRSRDQHAAALQAQLDQTQAEAEALRRRLADLERDRLLERELLRAGAADAETALALARERLAQGEPPEDLAAFAKALLDEKPHLRAGPNPATGPVPGRATPPPVLPPATAGAKPPAEGPQRTVRRLADQARQSGRPADLLAYMRARRGLPA